MTRSARPPAEKDWASEQQPAALEPIWGGNINPEKTYPSMFEPVRGAAPDIAGKGIANPLAEM